MFDSKTTLAARLSDAADLLIDFATLGEYGLEPAGEPRGCQARRRPHPSRSAARPRTSNRARGVAVRG
jgi:hypothetical protein